MLAPLNRSYAQSHIACCTACQAVVSVPNLEKNQHAGCPRCHHVLSHGSRWGLFRCSMLAISILILMPFALSYPLLSIELLGMKVDASILQGIWKMATQGYPYTAFLVFLCAVFMPIAFATLILLLRLCQFFHIKPRLFLLSLGYIKPWVMFDVYLVALAVTMFKVREYADLRVDVYLIAFIFTALLTTLLFIRLNLNALWNDFYPQQTLLKTLPQGKIQNCPACQYTFVQATLDRKDRQICPRCYTGLNVADNIKLQRTWATLIAGTIMLIPANLLPMSVIYMNGVPHMDTLMSGVLSFIDMGSYFIAFIVFAASIFVPFSKILIMLYLLICVHFKLAHSIKWQMRLLHIVHFIGRWSMLDLFVLALMMSLVSRGQIIDFSVGPAAFYFGVAVFLTMISTSQFDSRLLWKIYDKQSSR